MKPTARRLSPRALVVAGVILVALTGGGFWAVHAGGGSGTATLPPPATTSPPNVPTARQVQALQDDLTSGNSARVAAALGAPSGASLARNLPAQLRALAPIVIDAGAWRAESPTLVATTATVGAGARRQVWQVELVQIDGTWRLATTTPQRPSHRTSQPTASGSPSASYGTSP
jgi:hypothetical protein